MVEDAIDAIKVMNSLNRKPVLSSASTGNLHQQHYAPGRAGQHAHHAITAQHAALGVYGAHHGDAHAEADIHDEDGNGYYDPSRANATHTGGVQFTAEFPRINAPLPYGGGTGRNPAGGDPVMAIGHKLGNTSPGRESGVDSSGLGKKTGDFGAFARKGKNPVTSSSLPNNAVPGAFRTATEAGKAGGGNSPERLRTPGGTRRGQNGLAVDEAGNLLMMGPQGALITNVQWSAMNGGQGAPPSLQQWVAMGNDPNQYQNFVQQVI